MDQATPADQETATGQRCATWARDVGLDPIGTIGAYAGFLLLEYPTPWPPDVNELDGVAPLASMLAARRIRLQAVLPEGGPRRVILYDLPSGTDDGERFAGYRRTSTVVGDGQGAVAAAVVALLDAPSGPEATPAGTAMDVLVCTHGRRDTCCGSRGTALTLELAAGAAGDGAGGVTWWRTSHTGGHRFAPTAVVLPEGTAWAYADIDLLERVTRRRGSAAPLLDRYRGCAGLGSPRIQALERAVLAEVGWDLLDRRRAGTEIDGDRVRLEAETEDGGVDAWEGRVAAGRRLSIPECGEPVLAAGKTTVEWHVADLERV